MDYILLISSDTFSGLFSLADAISIALYMVFLPLLRIPPRWASVFLVDRLLSVPRSSLIIITIIGRPMLICTLQFSVVF